MSMRPESESRQEVSRIFKARGHPVYNPDVVFRYFYSFAGVIKLTLSRVNFF